MDEHPRVQVGPVPIHDASRADVLDLLMRLHAEGQGARVATANADFVALARQDKALARDLADSSLVVADGAPVAWLARAAGARRLERVTGVDLAPMLLERFRANSGARVAIYGSLPDVANAAAEALRGGDERVLFDPVICPPFRELTEQELHAHREAIAAAKPDLVLVALGCPRQERFIAEHFTVAPSAIWVGIGGSLDFHAGRRRRAPEWAQQAGLEWAVRLAQEPGRLWRRYVLRDFPTLLTTAPGCLRAGFRARRVAFQRTLN